MKLLRPKDVADILQVSQATICRMASAGELPCVVLRAGRRKKVVRFREEEIERWLTQRTHGGGTGQGWQRKRARIGNGLATEKRASMQRLEPQRKNDNGHGTVSPVPE
jgi:excisionase family DNA binding protein